MRKTPPKPPSVGRNVEIKKTHRGKDEKEISEKAQGYVGGGRSWWQIGARVKRKGCRGQQRSKGKKIKLFIEPSGKNHGENGVQKEKTSRETKKMHRGKKKGGNLNRSRRREFLVHSRTYRHVTAGCKSKASDYYQRSSWGKSRGKIGEGKEKRV